MNKFGKFTVRILSIILAGSVAAGIITGGREYNSVADYAYHGNFDANRFDAIDCPIDLKTDSFFDDSVVYRLPETLSDGSEVSVIVSLGSETSVDMYNRVGCKKSLSEFLRTDEAKAVADKVRSDCDGYIAKLDRSGIRYTLGERYDTILNGFEITVSAGDFGKVGQTLGDEVSLIVGETYEKAESKVITNEVKVYPTGIFDTYGGEYQGDGVVVAVLDTGLDYTHTAFSDENFDAPDESLAFSYDDISDKISSTKAAEFTSGLTAADVWRGRKVPFSYDYADKDSDVFPINSEHGTHVAGIIAGKDAEITGVAPRAQLAIMKVFSDFREGSKTSWILAALEDCVNLGVDVINMSLGASCGFARAEDDEQV
ncbi:MAG TPA: hypothetical protein DDW54_00720, partial [Clostridiales bacterium]|nr:hypothetical protein [Clostridiales bacterium]